MAPIPPKQVQILLLSFTSRITTTNSQLLLKVMKQKYCKNYREKERVEKNLLLLQRQLD
jgi:hypothetical protein